MVGQNEWVKGYVKRGAGPVPHTQSASYSLNDLAARGFLKRSDVNGMLIDSGLRDFTWHIVWADEANTADSDLTNRCGSVEGYAVFIHGWTGSNAIWEDLPGMVVTRNPQVVSIVVDHNGFGGTPFVKDMPDFDHCSPVAAMRTIERWFDLLRLRRQPGDPKPKVVNFIGHSMGGAALFFLNESKWRIGEQARLAIAPALLLHDDSHRAFYTTLGLGIGLVGRIQILELIENLVSPRVLDVLTEGSSAAVKDEHARIYAGTPRGVTARTFSAMGVLQTHPDVHRWELMRVVLGHKDVLVGLVPMLNLLDELGFEGEQVRVVFGTHYLFSLGETMKRTHEHNRALVLHDILTLHKLGLQRQRG